MINENIERGFSWRDFDNLAAGDNPTVQGFLKVLNEAFHIDSASYDSLSSRLENISIWTAIEKKILDEPTMDLIAKQMNFPSWEYAGKFNLVAPFDTVLKRKQEILSHVVRIMRSRGTPYSIEQALLAFGFTDVSILENVNIPVLYDGTFKYDGKATYSGTLKHQLFSVELTSGLDLAPPSGVDEQLDAIINIINAFKKYRPELYQIIAYTPSVPLGDIRTIWS